MKTLRDNIPEGKRDKWEREITQTFLRQYGHLKTFFIYNSIFSEVSTKGIISALQSMGKTVLMPRIEKGKMFPCFPSGFKKGVYGIEEPLGEIYTGEIDICVCPLLCVNYKGYRLGYGGGYYDGFLQGKNILKIGLCFFEQMADFDEEIQDIPLDGVICERGLLLYEQKQKH